MYKRKTKDIYAVEGMYGVCGWEILTESYSYKEAKEDLKAYDENETGFPHRIKKRRERIA